MLLKENSYSGLLNETELVARFVQAFYFICRRPNMCID